MDFDMAVEYSRRKYNYLYGEREIDPKWDMRFLSLAENVSTWSKDPSTKVGAVFVEPKSRRVLSMGYNGFPQGIRDTPERLADREKKLKLIVHAEMNAIYNATQSGVSLKGSILYVTGLPLCSDCCKGVIQVGTAHVVCGYTDEGRWADSFKESKELLEEARIPVEVYRSWR